MSQLQGQVTGTPDTGGPPSNIFSGSVLIDTWALGGGLTQGGYTIVPLSAQPTLSRPWTIMGWALQAKGVLVRKIQGGTLAPPYGQLGKVYASLMVGSGLPPTGPAVTPFIPPPSQALQNLALLWDGSVDPPFPWGSDDQPPAGGFIQTVQALPIPQQLQSGEQLAIGLWLTPSIVGPAVSAGAGSLSIAIYNVSYSVTYE